MSADLLHWATLDVNPLTATNTDLDEYNILKEPPSSIADLEPGETFFLDAYPTESAAGAVRRLRTNAGSPPVACIRQSDEQIVFHGIASGASGRLGAWTGLAIGQALCWVMCPASSDIALAVRIAQFLERKGAGRYIVFDDDPGFHLWVRRVG